MKILKCPIPNCISKFPNTEEGKLFLGKHIVKNHSKFLDTQRLSQKKEEKLSFGFCVLGLENSEYRRIKKIEERALLEA